MFGTAGIRGVTNSEITADLALGIARAFGEILCAEKEDRVSVGIAHDTRYGAELLARSATAGFASAGCDVHHYGCLPTGAYCVNLSKDGLDGGIMITGSHMPPDRIGIIAMLGDGA